ncbi:MAG TPA: hypothetical protein VF997_15100 [Polyangia bacterium]
MRPFCGGVALALLAATSGCNPYNQRAGEFIAGAADPVNYPPAYVGTGGDRTRPGRGAFTELRAYAGGNAIGYYSFPFSTTQLPAMPSAANPVFPLRLLDNGVPYAKVPTPTTYVFDPSVPCRPPAGYVYDPQRDDVPYDQQGAIFTALPSATYTAGALPTWSYVPVVAEALAQAPGLGCQAIKSEATLKASAGGAGAPDGNYLAYAIIDVAAPVYRVGQTATTSNGIGVQKLGWFNHYIVAYLDGGAVPTEPEPTDATKTQMHAQKLYYPRSMVTKGTNTFPGGIGFGYDVVEHARGDAGYSPVCQVFTYDTGAATPVEMLPQDATTITSMYSATLKPATVPYVFCLQVL